ncbi:MAG TPA: ATP-binding cassette domain-containing protein [Solirubrobacteraceae bacterium]|jgi:ABC-type multidrug transport system fused ATPase/permease subunit
MIARPVTDAGVTWVAHAGQHVVVHAARGSQAAEVAPSEARRADRAVAALEGLLQPPGDREGQPVDVYLVDPVPGAPPGHDEAGGGGILRVARSDATGESLVLQLARVLIPRWYGERSASASAFITGVAGVAAARAGLGPPITEIDDRVRAQLAAGRRPAPDSDAGATSFVAHLVESNGARSLGSFLGRYDPDRRDEAAVAVYQKPLAALAEAWLAALARGRRGGSLRYLMTLLGPHRRRHAEIVAYQVVSALAALVLPLASGCVVRALPATQAGGSAPHTKPDAFCDAVAPAPLTGSRLALIVLALAGVYAVDTAVALRRNRVETLLFNRVANAMRERLFTHLQRLSHGYYARANTGDVLSRLTADTNVLQASMTQLFGLGSLMTLTAAAAVATAILKSPAVGAFVLVIVPAFAVAQRRFGRRMGDAALRAQQVYGETLSVAQESLSAQAATKALGLEERARSSYRGRLDALGQANLRVAAIRQKLDSTASVGVALGQLLVLGVGGYLVLHRTGNVATITTLLVLLPQIMLRISVLLNAQQAVQNASGSIARITELLEQPIEVEDRPGATAMPPPSREIRLEGVGFGYDADRPVLRDVDLSIRAGTSVAIVGPSGSGKSTVVNLMMRFWDPQEGRVVFDGHDVRDRTLVSLRGQIGLVFQDPFVFNSTLRDNIAVGRLGATDAEIEGAARSARLDELVAGLPAGYDTVLGERGVRMSGGQRQRLAIARALLRDPPVLILDEPTSALDARTEAEILDTLAAAMRGRTTITITHRLALAAGADLVIVLDGGRVAERGTHAELVAAGGLYQRLWAEQTGRSPMEATGPLAGVPLLAGVPAEHLAALAGRLVRQRYGAGDVVVRQGDPADKLYLIRHGQADVLVADDHGQRLVNRLHAGDYFGEYALLAGVRRTATVRAAAPLDVDSLDRADLLSAAERQPAIQATLSRFVAQRRAAYLAAERAAGVDVRQRFTEPVGASGSAA